MLRSFLHGLRRLFRSNAVERELADEVDHYVESAAEEYVRRGLSREAALRAARMDMGGIESVKERVRSAGWEASIESLWRDLAYACRGLRRNPTFALVAIATLAIGIGAATAMFSVLNAVLLRPLPYHDPDRLVLLWTDDIKRGLHNENTAYTTIADWRRDNRTFSGIAFFNSTRATLGTGTERERVGTSSVSGNLFAVLAVNAAKGRTISTDDERAAAPVAVISHALWTSRFGSDPNIIGAPIGLEDWQGKSDAISTVTVIGVMPAGFYFPNRTTHIWTPATIAWRWTRESTERFESWARQWTPIARLRDNTSFADARADLARLEQHLTSIHATDVPGFPGFAVNMVPFLDSITGVPLQRGLSLLMIAVGLVLLVACVNLVNLLLARGAARRQEFAMRRALGASRLRLIRQQLVESFTLAALGGSVGLLLALWMTRVLVSVAASRIPRLDEGTIDMRVMAFAAAASTLTAIVFGVFPALRVTMTDHVRIVRSRGWLVAIECALAVILLIGAGLLLRSLSRLTAVEPGFEAADVLIARLELPREHVLTATADGTATDVGRARRREQTQQALIDGVRALPGVQSVAVVDDLFVTGQGRQSIAFPDVDTSTVPAGELAEALVSPDFFTALRVPLRAGRYLRRDDGLKKIQALYSPLARDLSLAEKARRAIAEPVVVNDAFVARFLKGRDVIGQRFCIDPAGKTYCYEIVGVVGDMHRKGRERPPIPEYYRPYLPAGGARADLIVRTAGDPLASAASVKQAIVAAVPGILVPRISSVERDLGSFAAERTLQTWLLAAFAALALALAAIGIYGMVHYAVAQRTREIGVRIAIGARPRDVFTQVLVEGIRLPLFGFGVGFLAALASRRVLQHMLFGIRESDPVTFVTVAATLLVTALIACYAPANRARRVDAVTALRAE